MNREFLKEQGLTNEQIEMVMKEHGKTVNSIKRKSDKVDGLERQIEVYKQQIKDRDKRLNELLTKVQDNEQLTAEIDLLEENYKKFQFQSKLENQEFDFTLEKATVNVGAKNPKAVKALLDTKKIKLDVAISF